MTSKKIIPIILCGGTGTRLWPLSRKSFPKQFLNLEENNNQSLLQNTCERILSIENLDNPILICNEEHRFITAEQLRKINIKPKSILLEPLGRGTAPAVTIAVLKALEKDKNPFLLVLSSDHIISNKVNFINTLEIGKTYANQGKIVTFGVKPTYPETGYGYIETENDFNNELKGTRIKRFVEKPNMKNAIEFFKNEKFLWNSGIFLFRANYFLQEINNYEPEIVSHSRKALENSKLDLDFERIDKVHFSKCKNIALDVAVMEKTNSGIVMPLNVGWKDIGSWDQVWENSKKDINGNVSNGNIFLEKSKNCLFKSDGRLIVGVNTDNLIVVDTNDALLILNKNKSQDIKDVIKKLKNKNIKEINEHSKIFRPWGNFITLVENSNWKVKKIVVKPNASLSLQLHKQRSEHWIVVSGEATIEIDHKISILKSNQSTYIPRNSKHRLSNKTKEFLTLIEVQSGDYLGEDDIIRFLDNYGRVNDISS